MELRVFIAFFEEDAEMQKAAPPAPSVEDGHGVLSSISTV